MPGRRTLLAVIASTASAFASLIILAAPANAETCEGTINADGNCEFFAQGSCPPGSTQIGAFADGTKRCVRPA
ncbi:MAG: hypothetical protein ACRDSR_03545 [Pseudonocardiaceae bacterium]